MSDERTGQKQEEIQLVVFRIGNEDFGVKIQQVREIVRLIPITPIPKAPDCIEGVVNLRGTILAVMDLSKRLHIKGNPPSEKTRIIVVELDNNVVGMIVDEVSEVLRIPLNRVEKTPNILTSEVTQKYISGVGKLESRLLILIDLSVILSLEELEQVKMVSETENLSGALSKEDNTHKKQRTETEKD